MLILLLFFIVSLINSSPSKLERLYNTHNVLMSQLEQVELELSQLEQVFQHETRATDPHDDKPHDPTSEEHTVEPGSGEYTFYIVASFSCIFFAGLMSGLTLGLLSFSVRDLEILLNAGTEMEKKYATKVLPLVKRHHWLLVTLLLCNALAMEALPLFLDRLVSAFTAILLSVTAVLVFGEVIPQALCSRYGLAIGARMAPMVNVLLFLTGPISYPLARALDVVLGEEHDSFFRRAQIKELVNFHSPDRGGPLTPDEVMLIKGAIDLSSKTVAKSMTPLSKVFMLNYNDIFDLETMKLCLSKGHSRVPVYRGSHQNILGLLMIKNLLHLDPDDRTPVKSLEFRPVPHVISTMPMYDLLHFMQSGRSHMVIVVNPESEEASEAIASETVLNSKTTDSSSLQNRLDDISSEEDSPNSFGTVVGIITLEDILEEILQSDIIDETDQYVDHSQRIRVAEFVHQLKTLHKDDQVPLDWVTPRSEFGYINAAANSPRKASASPARKRTISDARPVDSESIMMNLIVPPPSSSRDDVDQNLLNTGSFASST